ncbi:MAG: hypothetical protein AB7S26_16755 [Sandaracinaceae bacterium]
MSAATKAPVPDELPEEETGLGGVGFEGPPPTIDALIDAEDGASLFALGMAYRVGTPFVGRDAFKALECFEAASRFGSEQAELEVALAHMNGRGVAQDLATGATRMRSAAQRGSLKAKVYVANLYELGVHYAADRDKADVWYRNVARAAGIEHQPGSEEYAVEMADLGCVRYCLERLTDERLTPKDRAAYLRKAKSMGYAHRLAEAKKSEPPASPVPSAKTAADASASTEASAPVSRAPSAPRSEEPPEDEANDEADAPQEEEKPAAEKAQKKVEDDDAASDAPLGGQWTFGSGMVAFGVGLFFVVSGSSLAFLANEGSRALAIAHRELPLIGHRHAIVAFGALVLGAVLPALSVYRPRVVALAAVLGAAGAAGGYFLFDRIHWLWDATAQASAAGLAVFLVVLLFLGILGGTRFRAPRRADPPARRAR